MSVKSLGRAGRLAALVLWGLSALIPVGAKAQAGEAPVGTAAVTGHVTCADTQHPARFAEVELIAAGAEDTNVGFRGRGAGGARTDLEGDYSIPNVSPGDYFVVAQMVGYVNLRNAVQAAMNAGTDPASAVPGVTRVHVGVAGGAADLLLQRGAVVAGTVAWDDGSPAAGVQVIVQAAPTTAPGDTASGSAATLPGRNTFSYLGGAQTDDRGRFRISGLAAGSYVVRASVQAPMPQQAGARYSRTLNVAVYAPDKPRRSEAEVVKLAAGEERDDVAVTMGLSALHTISGVVSSPGAAVRSGTVNVTDQTDASLNRTGVINADGSFTVAYVPPGSYTLHVNASARGQGEFGRGGGGNAGGPGFQPLQESVTITDSDLTGVNVTVVPTAGASGS